MWGEYVAKVHLGRASLEIMESLFWVGEVLGSNLMGPQHIISIGLFSK